MNCLESMLRGKLISCFVAVVAAGLCQSAFAAKSSAPEFAPPRRIEPAPAYGDCRASGSIRVGIDERISASLTIAKDGSIEDISLPDSSPAWMTELANCALRRMQFAPAMLEGKGVESELLVSMEFGAGVGMESGSNRIVALGPIRTFPRILDIPGMSRKCYPASARVDDVHVGHIVVRLTILPDGSFTDLKVPAGAPEWAEDSARCILGHVQFFPGTMDGEPVPTESTLPLGFYGSDNPGPSSKMDLPQLVSDTAELETAYRACYPPDLVSMATIAYRFTVHTNGQVTRPQVVKSSGDPRLDEAGTCVLRLLRFTPLLQGKRRLKSEITWELPIRPPRTR